MKLIAAVLLISMIGCTRSSSAPVQTTQARPVQTYQNNSQILVGVGAMYGGALGVWDIADNFDTSDERSQAKMHACTLLEKADADAKTVDASHFDHINGMKSTMELRAYCLEVKGK